MGRYSSPGVYAKTRDLSDIVPGISTTTGAIIGFSKKGSLDYKLITNPQQFVEEYGEPAGNELVYGTNYFHYTALAFLENGTRLYCRRIVAEDALYSGAHVKDTDESGAGIVPLTTGRSTQAFYDESGILDELLTIYAKDPGAWGDNISITISSVQATTDAVNNPLTDDETYTFIINVYFTDSDGNVSQLEAWKVSRQTKVDGYGKQLYVESKINGYSDYIEVYDNTIAANTVLPKESTANDTDNDVFLGGGANGALPDSGDYVGTASGDTGTGWHTFYNVNDIPVQILLGGCFTSAHTVDDIAAIQTGINTIAEHRRDCVAILDTPYDCIDEVTTTYQYRLGTYLVSKGINLNSSYSAMYAPWVKVNDPYTDQVLELPPSGYVGSQYTYNDYVANVWDAPAAFNRGRLNVLGVTYAYTQGERDTLYEQEVNPLQTFRGSGNVIYGQKNLQRKNSSLDRVNVRRLLNMIEKSLSLSLESFVFEPNNEMTRFRIISILEEYLFDLSARGAFQIEGGDNGFHVVCDTTNNTPYVIDSNELHVDVFLKPIHTAEFIQLTTIITKTGTSFEELVSRGTLF